MTKPDTPQALPIIEIRRPDEDDQRRAAQALAANKAAIFDALAEAGLDRLEVSFDGCGDSGQLESLIALPGSRAAALTEASVLRLDAFWGQNTAERRITLEDAIEEVCYDLLSLEHDGWEIDDGAFGEFGFDVAARTITLDFNERYTAHVAHGHEY